MAVVPAVSRATPYRIRPFRPRVGGVGAVGAVAGTSVAIAAVELWFRPHVVNPSLGAALETAITIAAMFSAILMRRHARRTRLLRDLLLLTALVTAVVTDLAFVGLPAVSDAGASSHGVTARTAAGALVALALLATAFAPSRRRLPEGSRLVWMLPFTGIVIVAIVEGIALMAAPAGRAGYELPTTVLTLASCGAMMVAGVRLASRGAPGRAEARLLAGAAFLLAAGGIERLALPSGATNWVTLSDVLRLAAYCLLLATALRRHDRTRKQLARDALDAERARIARDLHDGLAQDLAFIAAHSERLAADLGAEHPVAVAAQRALAQSRLEIVDLSASTAPGLDVAMRDVAAELALRLGIKIEVKIDEGADLQASRHEREELVRIAREAIMNAALRGGAEHVIVTLGARWSDLVLRVSDDGSGIGTASGRSGGTGLGMSMMRARARALGARLVARRRVGGGTDIDVLAAPVGPSAGVAPVGASAGREAA